MIIFLYCLVTVVIETAFLALVGFRSMEEIKIIICANVMTNLSLNFILWFAPRTLLAIILLEIMAIAVECNIYGTLFEKTSRMYLLTIAANVISFGVGALLFGL